MSGPRNARSLVAWSTFGAAMVMASAAAALWIVNARTAKGVLAPQIFVVPGFGLVGAIITARSRNLIGPLFLALAFFGSATAFTFEYAIRALGTAPGSLPLGGYAGALSYAGFPFTFLALGLTLLLFPDGRLPSKRWRAATWGFTIVWGLETILSLVAPTLELGDIVRIQNPIGLGGLTFIADPGSPVALMLSVVAFILLTAMVAAPIVRRRRADAETRQQLRWLALVLEAILVLGVLGFGLAAFHAELAGAVVDVAMLALVALGIPAAIGVAVMKYRLYDLDVVINKTVVYGALALFITAVYVGVVVGIGSVAGSTGNPALSAVAAATVALAFQPARRRAQRLADRLVYGERATPLRSCRSSPGVCPGPSRPRIYSPGSRASWPRARGPRAPTCGCARARSSVRSPRGRTTHLTSRPWYTTSSLTTWFRSCTKGSCWEGFRSRSAPGNGWTPRKRSSSRTLRPKQGWSFATLR